MVVRKSTIEVVLMVRWTCIFVSGAFGRGNESSIGFTEGSKAAAAPEISMAGIALTSQWRGAEMDKDSKTGRVFEGGLARQNLVGLHGSTHTLSLPFFMTLDKASLFNFASYILHTRECKYTW
jgi:hypothetical protein